MRFVLLAILPVLFEGGDSSGYTKVPAPGVRYRMNMATATRAPWIDSNIWRYKRNPGGSYWSDVSEKSVEMAMAEAFSQGVKLSVQTSAAQKPEFDAMTAFLKTIPDGPKKPWANITVSDDGSPLAGEALLLLTRRNLFYRIAPKDSASAVHLNLNSKIGNVYDFVLDARDKLGDEKRPLRLFGSELTVADLAREGNRVRLHLINYGSRPVVSLRVRLEGSYRNKPIMPHVYKDQAPKFTDLTIDGKFTEFTLESLPVYAVLDLTDQL